MFTFPISRLPLVLSVTLLAACAGVQQAPAPAAATPTAQETPAARQSSERRERQLMDEVDEDNAIFFPPSGTAVDAEGRKRLAVVAERLKSSNELVVTLVGHTDDQGSPSYNLAIAEQRVNAVFSVLRSQGVPAIQIRRYGVGGEKGSFACKSAQCRKLMRRVQLVFDKG